MVLILTNYIALTKVRRLWKKLFEDQKELFDIKNVVVEIKSWVGRFVK